MKKVMYPLASLALIAFLVSCNSNDTSKDVSLPAKILIQNEGVHIDYTDSGNGDTTLLFVHGWCINKTYWSDQVSFFSKKYRVITIDLPGFGASGKNRASWNTQTFGRDIDSVIYVLNLKNVILIGHSMAGDIILEAAVKSTDNVIGLVGVDNFKNTGQVQTKEDKENYKKAIDSLKINFKATASDYFNQALFYKTTADSIKKRILGEVSVCDSVIAVACIAQDDFDEVKKLVAVKKKLSLINSDYTPTDTSSFVANHIPYELFLIHNTGHFPMVEKPVAFDSLLQIAITRINIDGK
ncbi:MAG: alpha/beta hydrolase [Ginsengibacter sp.]